jgi:hypothetical protein
MATSRQSSHSSSRQSSQGGDVFPTYHRVASLSAASFGAVALETFDQSGGVIPQDHRSQDYPVFHLSTMLEQTMYHILYPISIPLVYLFRGHAAAMNMRFMPSRDQSYIALFQFALYGAVLAILVLFLASVPSAPAAGNSRVLFYFTMLEMVVAVSTSSFQRLAIATKWAYMSRSQYNYLMSHRARFELLQADQIVNAW